MAFYLYCWGWEMEFLRNWWYGVRDIPELNWALECHIMTLGRGSSSYGHSFLWPQLRQNWLPQKAGPGEASQVRKTGKPVQEATMRSIKKLHSSLASLVFPRTQGACSFLRPLLWQFVMNGSHRTRCQVPPWLWEAMGHMGAFSAVGGAILPKLRLGETEGKMLPEGWGTNRYFT